MLKLLRHLLCTLQTPSRYLAHTNQTASRHLLDILPLPLNKVYIRHPPNSSLLYCKKVEFSTRAGAGGWVVAGPQCKIMPLCGPTCKIARIQARLKFPSWTKCGKIHQLIRLIARTKVVPVFPGTLQTLHGKNIFPSDFFLWRQLEYVNYLVVQIISTEITFNFRYKLFSDQ